jgi:hypothetical protein
MTRAISSRLFIGRIGNDQDDGGRKTYPLRSGRGPRTTCSLFSRQSIAMEDIEVRVAALEQASNLRPQDGPVEMSLAEAIRNRKAQPEEIGVPVAARDQSETAAARRVVKGPDAEVRWGDSEAAALVVEILNAAGHQAALASQRQLPEETRVPRCNCLPDITPAGVHAAVGGSVLSAPQSV